MEKDRTRRLIGRLTQGLLAAVMVIILMPGTIGKAKEMTAPGFQSAKNYGGAKTDSFLDVAYTKDGGFVAMGYSMGASTEPEWTHSGSANNNDAILVKFDMDHRVEWAQAYGDTGVDVFNSMDILKDGRIAVVGRSAFTSSDSSIKGVSWYLLLINPNDPTDYVDYRIGGSAGDQGYGVAATSDGGFVAAGWSASKAGYICHSTDQENYTDLVQLWEAQDGTNEDLPNRVASVGSDSVVIKFNKDGEVVYTSLHNYEVTEKAYNITSPSERLTGITVDSQDNIYLVGYGAVAKSVQNGVVAKLKGADGSLLWHRSAGRAKELMTVVPTKDLEKIKAEYNGVAVLSDGSVVVSGEADKDASSEENWQVIGANDALWVHYSEDGDVLGSQCVGTISYRTTNDIGSKHASVTAAPDGGFLFAGTQFGVRQEDDMIEAGYNWGNYGSQDGILIKYDSAGRPVWSGNYGSRQGDWINSVIIRDDGEMIAVGESNGRNGNPAWSNNGGIDGIVMCSNLYPEAYTKAVNASSDGNVIWADGTYTATGDGYGGKDSITATAVIENGTIKSLTGEGPKESTNYYAKAAELYDRILEKQSADVDAVSRATMSSQGIIEAAGKCLGQAAAAHVDMLISAIEGAEDKNAATKAAVDAYGELGTYSAGQLKNLDMLETAAQTYAITLASREDTYESITAIYPETGQGLAYNDTYYKLQYKYMRNINGEILEKKGFDGDGITIAVIDSGITPAHQDLDYSRILDGYDYDSGTVMPTADLADENGHGTAVAGILAARRNNRAGVAGLFDKVKLLPLKVTPSKKLDENSSNLVARAIMDAVDTYKVDVITTSLEVKDTEALQAAVKHAEENKVIITGAAGNSSDEANNGADPYVYPASYEEVIGVGAVDLKNQVRATSQKNDTVYVTAPGEEMTVLDLSANKRCKMADGTSYASPLVAAMAVAAKQYNKNITTEEFKILLQESSKDAGKEGYDTSYGFGIIDYKAFIHRLAHITVDYNINLDQTELTMNPDQKVRLNATVTPDDAENKMVIWTSSNDDVVKVDDQGMLTAAAIGEATITAACAGDSTVQAQCKVMVKAKEEPETEAGIGPADGSYTGSALCEQFGYSISFTAVFKDGKLVDLKNFMILNNDDEDNEDFIYDAWDNLKDRLLAASENDPVDIVAGATHSSNAILTAYRNAYNQALEASRAAAKTKEEKDTKPDSSTPQKTAVKKITITSTLSTKIAAGKKVKLKATISPANATNKKVIWSSSNKKVATVNQKGLVSFKKKAGGNKVVIKATAADGSGKAGKIKLTAMKGMVKKIIIKGKKQVKAGKAIRLRATVKATKNANKKLKWTSLSPKYATVSQTGKVKAKAAGKGKTVKIIAMATDGTNRKKVIKIKIR